MKTEIIIIGGGIAGCSAAYFLSKGGHKVTLLERKPGVGLEASGVNCCGVRQQGRKRMLPMAMESVRIWKTLAEELGSDVEYRQTGNLKVRFYVPDLSVLEEETEWEHAQGLTESRMLTKQECLELIPGLSDTIVGGKFCPTDGNANPMLVCPAFARAAARLGAEIRPNTTVTGLLMRGASVCGVTTTSGEIEAEIVINAAGPWAARFNEMAGCYTPIRPQMVQLMITERMPRKFAPWLGFGPTAVEIVQTKAGNMVIATGKPPIPIITYQRGMDYGCVSRGSQRIVELLPWLANVHMIRSCSGLTEGSPDSEPYIGALPGVAGYFTSCGFSGQGFCIGPMVGKTVAAVVTGQEPGVSLADFKPERFAVSMPWPEFELVA